MDVNYMYVSKGRKPASKFRIINYVWIIQEYLKKTMGWLTHKKITLNSINYTYFKF